MALGLGLGLGSGMSLLRQNGLEEIDIEKWLLVRSSLSHKAEVRRHTATSLDTETMITGVKVRSRRRRTSLQSQARSLRHPPPCDGPFPNGEHRVYHIFPQPHNSPVIDTILNPLGREQNHHPFREDRAPSIIRTGDENDLDAMKRVMLVLDRLEAEDEGEGGRSGGEGDVSTAMFFEESDEGRWDRRREEREGEGREDHLVTR